MPNSLQQSKLNNESPHHPVLVEVAPTCPILLLYRLGTNIVIERERYEILGAPASKPAFTSLKKKSLSQPITFISYFCQGTFIKEVKYTPFGMRWSPLNLTTCKRTAMTLLALVINLQNPTFFMASVPRVLTTLLFFH